MFKSVVDFLSDKNIIFKSISVIEPKELGSRKRVDIYLAVDMRDYYNLIISISKKSRFIQKDEKDLIELHKRLEELKDIKIKKKLLLIDGDLCSKAKKVLIDDGWRVFEV